MHTPAIQYNSHAHQNRQQKRDIHVRGLVVYVGGRAFSGMGAKDFGSFRYYREF